MKYIPLFILIQVISALLFLPGIVLCGLFARLGWYSLVPNPTPIHPWNDKALLHWKARRLMWIFDNEEDGLAPKWYLQSNIDRSLSANIFIWTAFRNYANNLRFVPGVSKIGRPLWLKTLSFRGKQYHIEAGWLSDGYPSFNFGPGPW